MLAFAAEGAILTSQARDGDVFFVWEPLYHIGGAQLIAIPLFIDLKLAMVRHLSATRFWEQVTASGATQIHYLGGVRSEEHTSELQSLMRISYAVFCLKK